MNGEISTQVVVDDRGMSGHGHVTVLCLSWQQDDPLAVHLSLDAHPNHPALPRGDWVVLRDFLRYGLDVPTGDGAVQIQPDGPGKVVLELHGDARPYRLHVPAKVLCDFLDATDEIVPAGAAAEDEVIDALINRLLEY